MQAGNRQLTRPRQMVTTAVLVALLALVAMVPAVGAMSLAPEDQEAAEESSSPASTVSSTLTREQIKFLEENWYYDAGGAVADAETGESNPASAGSVLRDLDRADRREQMRSSREAFDFDAMERAPGLYTASSRADEGSGDGAASNPALIHDQIKFLEDNWHLGSGILTDDEEVADAGSGNPALTRDEIQFLEDNWHLDTGEVFSRDDEDEAASAGSTGVSDSDADADTDQEGVLLPHPWGGNTPYR